MPPLVASCAGHRLRVIERFAPAALPQNPRAKTNLRSVSVKRRAVGEPAALKPYRVPGSGLCLHAQAMVLVSILVCGAPSHVFSVRKAADGAEHGGVER